VGESTGPAILLLNSGSITVDSLVVTNGANSIIHFNGGLLTSSGTAVTNGQVFAVGNAVTAATYELDGGVHSFENNLEIHNNATLTGCGTVTGNVVVDAGGTVVTSCGGSLTFTGIVTNNGTMLAIDGSVLKSYGAVVNNGVINAINGSTDFLGGLINNGTVIDANNVRISKISRTTNNITVQIPSAGGCTYQLQSTPSLKPTNWVNTGSSQAGTGDVLTFTDTDGATNHPSRFYRFEVTVP
jgi:hypothetical protein